MNTKTTLSITEARKNIFDLADAVQQPGVYYTFTDKGRPKAVLMSAEEFESWQETFEVMRELPDLAKDIQSAEDEFKRGDYITLEELLQKEGYTLSNRGAAIHYEIPSGSTKKSTKRA